jgi:hypothetical protein
VTIVVDALVVAGGIVLGRWILRRARARRSKAADPGTSAQVTARPSARDDALRAFPCALGDVVVRVAERDEAWLAGALVLEEQSPVAVLFVAPEAGGDRALFVRASDKGVTWLAPLAPGALPLPKDPPHALELAGERFERARRLPVKVSRLGTGAPAVGERAIVAEYAGPGAERLLLVVGTDATMAWRGEALREGEYDVLPGGKETLGA